MTDDRRAIIKHMAWVLDWTAIRLTGRPGRVLAWSGPARLITDVVAFIALLVVVSVNPRS